MNFLPLVELFLLTIYLEILLKLNISNLENFSYTISYRTLSIEK